MAAARSAVATIRLAASDASRPGNRPSADLVFRIRAFATGLQFATACSESGASRRNAAQVSGHASMLARRQARRMSIYPPLAIVMDVPKKVASMESASKFRLAGRMSDNVPESESILPCGIRHAQIEHARRAEAPFAGCRGPTIMDAEVGEST